MKKLLYAILTSITLFAGERSSQWPGVRKQYLSIHARCEACGTLKSPQVHHIIPVNTDASKELDMDNLITLCKGNCHLKIGHGGSYKYYNPEVRRHSSMLLNGDSYDRIVTIAKQSRIINKNNGEKNDRKN